MSYLVGIDVGGTFTDFVAFDSISDTIKAWKVLSTPDDPVVGIINGLRAEVADLGSIEAIRLGTTIGTNALLERTGATVAYVTTKGFKDTIFIARGNRRYHYDMSWVKPKPLAMRRHCFELAERVDKDGRVITPLDDAEVFALAAQIKADPSIEAVAVCLLFSYLNPSHELRVKEILRAELPDRAISVSYDVLPKWKEYERASTTLADAYLKPIVSQRMGEMRARLDDAGIAAPTVVIKSNGGQMSLGGASDAPVNLVVSGPTGGVIASCNVAKATGIANLVTVDIGGTSTDVSVVIDGAERLTTAFEIEWGVPVQIPIIDIRTIGAGGGSIGWIDKGGMLRVGPQSAGARPGPACYGRGEAPTVTDANLILGRIDADNFLGGKMPLYPERARAAIQTLATELSQDVEDVALAMVRIANSNMVGALRSVLIEGGLDPRDFTLSAFGGAGPLHVGDLMIDMGIPNGIVPNNPGQFSASGFVTSQARVDRQRTAQLTSHRFDSAKASAIMEQLVAEAGNQLTEQGFGHDITTHRRLEMRYLGQNYELEIPIEADMIGDGADLVELWEEFHRQHDARFGFRISGEIIEIVNFSVTAIAHARIPDLPRIRKADGALNPVGKRWVRYPEGKFEVPIYRRDEMLSGHKAVGPLLVEESASVTVICAGQELTVDDYGHLLITTVRS
jgi:N-methylhydantoinase A